MTRQDILDHVGPAAWSGNIAAQALWSEASSCDEDSLARFAHLNDLPWESDEDDPWESDEDDF